jgi:hypothetical protein
MRTPLEQVAFAEPASRCHMRFLLLVTCLLLRAAFVRADGIPIEKGRYTGTSTLIDLQPEQMNAIGINRALRLNDTQKAQLIADAKTAPSILQVIVGKEAEASCTCCTYNVAVWLSRNILQVPHAFLRPDGHRDLPPSDRSTTVATPGTEKTLRVIVDLDAQLRVEGRVATLKDIETIIRKSRPRVGHIILLLPPRAPDINVPAEFRTRVYKTLFRFAEKYETGCVSFE